MIRPIETANWHDHERRAEPAGSRRFRGRSVGLEHLSRLESRQEEGRIEAADDPDQQRQTDRRQQNPAVPEIVEARGRHRGRPQTASPAARPAPTRAASRPPRSGSIRRRTGRSAAARLAPSTLRNATSRARWLARAVARLVKFTTAIPRISSGDDREGRDRPSLIARSHRSVLRLAEVNVLQIDEMPILVVAGIVSDATVRLVGDVALFPRRLLRLDLLHVGARA